VKLRKRLNFATHGQDGGWYVAGDFVLVEPSPSSQGADTGEVSCLKSFLLAIQKFAV
jgi:hypothetical protein